MWLSKCYWTEPPTIPHYRHCRLGLMRILESHYQNVTTSLSQSNWPFLHEAAIKLPIYENSWCRKMHLCETGKYDRVCKQFKGCSKTPGQLLPFRKDNCNAELLVLVLRHHIMCLKGKIWRQNVYLALWFPRPWNGKKTMSLYCVCFFPPGEKKRANMRLRWGRPAVQTGVETVDWLHGLFFAGFINIPASLQNIWGIFLWTLPRSR